MKCIPHERGGSGNRFNQRQSVSLSCEWRLCSVWPKWKCMCGLECCRSINARPCDDNASPKTDPLVLLVCVRYVVQEGMSCVSWDAGRRISRLSIIMVRRDLHSTATTDLGYVWIIYSNQSWSLKLLSTRNTLSTVPCENTSTSVSSLFPVALTVEFRCCYYQ